MVGPFVRILLGYPLVFLAPWRVCAEVRECPLPETLLDTALAEKIFYPLPHGPPALGLLLLPGFLCRLPVLLLPIGRRLLAVAAWEYRVPYDDLLAEHKPTGFQRLPAVFASPRRRGRIFPANASLPRLCWCDEVVTVL